MSSPAPLKQSAGNELREALLRTEAEVRRLTRRDALTGCLSRAGLSLTLRERPITTAVVIVFGCDDFERVNEELGYATGDVVLRSVAQRLAGALRGDDLLVRLGGDLFLAVLPGVQGGEARAIAERARLAVASEPFGWEPGPLHLTVSVGLAWVRPGCVSFEELVSTARLAMKRSKARGKNRVSVPEDAAVESTVDTLLAAVERSEGLVVHAQTLRGLVSESVVGWEMLVRGPRGDLEAPGHLFRAAQEHQMAVALDLRCLRMCAAAARAHGLRGQIHLNVLPSTVLAVPPDELLALIGSPPAGGGWCLELSERQFLGAPEELVEALATIREAGVLLAIDDVGSARGTLDSVVLLEPDIAKLDIRLVRGLATDERRKHTVGRLVHMCRALEVEVVAEGVEDRADLAVLVALGVRRGQGWLWDPAQALRG